MRRSFLLVTAGAGTALGWLVTIPVGVVVEQPVAFLLGTVVACLFVGTVFELVGER